MLHTMDSDATLKLISQLITDSQKQLKGNEDALVKPNKEDTPTDTLDRTS